jgi:hypothetical protein
MITLINVRPDIFGEMKQEWLDENDELKQGEDNGT